RRCLPRPSFRREQKAHTTSKQDRRQAKQAIKNRAWGNASCDASTKRRARCDQFFYARRAPPGSPRRGDAVTISRSMPRARRAPAVPVSARASLVFFVLFLLFICRRDRRRLHEPWRDTER